MNIINEAFEEQPKDNTGRFMGVDDVKTKHPRNEKGKFDGRKARSVLKQNNNYLDQLDELIKNNKRGNILGNYYTFEQQGQTFIILFYIEYFNNRLERTKMNVVRITTKSYSFNENSSNLENFKRMASSNSLRYNDIDNYYENGDLEDTFPPKQKRIVINSKNSYDDQVNEKVDDFQFN